MLDRGGAWPVRNARRLEATPVCRAKRRHSSESNDYADDGRESPYKTDTDRNRLFA
jgi:hypothetical protein